MSRLYTRRAFLSWAGAAATTAGLIKLFRIAGADLISAEGQCPKCKAFYIQAHKHKGKHTSGVYCPNCGIELSRQVYDPASKNRFRLVSKRKRQNKRSMAWEWAQVPFPNAKLIRQSGKPTVVFSDMKI